MHDETGGAPPTPPAAAPGRPLRLGVLASGSGTNLQVLLDTFTADAADGDLARVVAVGGDRPGATALERADRSGVPWRAFPRDDHPTRDARDAAIAAWLHEHDVDLVVLAGYMAILTPTFLRAFPDRVVNVHPSLLPAFPGIRAVEQAVAYGVRTFGVTVHLVDDGVDTGPVLLQDAVVLDDTPDADAALAAIRPLEHRLLPEAVRIIARGGARRDPDAPRRVLLDRG